MHGLYRSLIHNMVVGVSEGYTIKQELVGVGYRANAEGQVLELGLGYSHGIFMVLPNEVKVSKPEPYKGKGIKFVGEVLRRKAGKSAKV